MPDPTPAPREGARAEGLAWQRLPDATDLKGCPTPGCGEVVLEGETTCPRCGVEPEDDTAWRRARAEGVEALRDATRLRALEAEREDAEVTALRWCVHGLPRDFKAMREEVRAELLLFALYLYARAQTNAVASAKAELDRYRSALEALWPMIRDEANTAGSGRLRYCDEIITKILDDPEPN